MADQEETPKEEETPKAEWEQRSEFRIHSHMQEIVKATVTVAEAQINLYKRKIEKLQYGS
jgi:hypothetical protein